MFKKITWSTIQEQINHSAKHASTYQPIFHFFSNLTLIVYACRYTYFGRLWREFFFPYISIPSLAISQGFLSLGVFHLSPCVGDVCTLLVSAVPVLDWRFLLYSFAISDLFYLCWLLFLPCFILLYLTNWFTLHNNNVFQSLQNLRI
jgi:hypothetical protein